jgi:hypothetical protein
VAIGKPEMLAVFGHEFTLCGESDGDMIPSKPADYRHDAAIILYLLINRVPSGTYDTLKELMGDYTLGTRPPTGASVGEWIRTYSK